MNSILARCRLPALVLGLALVVGCDDDDGPTDPGPDLPGDLIDRIEALFPEGSTRDMAFDQVTGKVGARVGGPVVVGAGSGER